MACLLVCNCQPNDCSLQSIGCNHKPSQTLRLGNYFAVEKCGRQVEVNLPQHIRDGCRVPDPSGFPRRTRYLVTSEIYSNRKPGQGRETRRVWPTRNAPGVHWFLCNKGILEYTDGAMFQTVLHGRHPRRSATIRKVIQNGQTNPNQPLE